MVTVKHNTLMPYKNMLYVSVYKSHRQTHALQKFNNISRIIKKFKNLKHKLNPLNTNMKIFHTQKEIELLLGYKYYICLLLS
jgi:23S rRNA maturation mini-RNase III